MPKFFRRLAVAGCCAYLSGCATQPYQDFVKDEGSGVSGDKIALLRFSRSVDSLNDPQSTPSEDVNETKRVKVLVAADASLTEAIKAHCGVDPKVAAPPPPIAPALVPLIAAFAQLGVNQYFEGQKRRIEEIVAASQASYSATAVYSPKTLSDTKCLLLLRYGDKQLGLAALVLFAKPSEVIEGTEVTSLRPVYLHARTAAAQTRKTDSPTIGMSIGLSLKAVGRQQSEILRLLPSGEGTASVANLSIGTNSKPQCRSQGCKSTDLIPYPTGRGLISLTMAVAEQGVTGFDDKVALAEIAALKEALGPAISEAVKAHFEKK